MEWSIHDTLFEKDHHQSQGSCPSHRLTVIHTHELESGIRKPIIKDPRTSKPMNLIVKEHQNVEQQVPHEETTLRRSIRVRNSAIASDYVVYLQESDYNVGIENDPKTFSQAIISKDSDLWYEAMKAEMDSVASNRVWDLVELPIGVNPLDVSESLKPRNSPGNFE